MNHVLDMLEELMVKVEQHEITFIIFSVMALLYLGTVHKLICCINITRHDLTGKSTITTLQSCLIVIFYFTIFVLWTFA